MKQLEGLATMCIEEGDHLLILLLVVLSPVFACGCWYLLVTSNPIASNK